MTDHEEIPVIWARMGDEIVTVTPSERNLPGWTRLANPELVGAFADLLGVGASSPKHVQVRTFTMRESDLSLWDRAVRKGSDGYSYGVLWGADSKIDKWVQFRENMPPAGADPAPALDPLTLATAVAVHQIQQTLAVLEEKIDAVRAAVQWLEDRRQDRQAAELLTAAATLASVARHCISSGEVHPEDLLRIAHLEQTVGTVHREVCKEIQAHARTLAFSDFKSAKRALAGDAPRVADLIALDAYALNALKTYHQLILLSKATGARLGENEIEETREELRRLVVTARQTVTELVAVDTRMSNRGYLDYMLTVGIPKGRADDAKRRRKVTAMRTKVQKQATKAAGALARFENTLARMDVLDTARRAPLALRVVDPAA